VTSQTLVIRRTSLALILLWLTIAYNALEGVIAITAAGLAGSVALMGFGLDSFIEVTAASILVWRLNAGQQSDGARRREHVAHQVVGATFVLLAAFIAAQIVYVVAVGGQPESSRLGLALAVASLVLMPALGIAKRLNATRMNSPALIAESTETLVCSYLSLTLFVGLGANALFGWWWADLAAAAAMVPWILKEAAEGIRGEGCDEACL
jgi:divalent metal cation (Fe/Co/Zn/Cd) transporter